MPTINRCGGGGDAIKEPYDFPLSMQTAEPTPVNTNHIWIHNDVKRPLAIDEAIRAADWNNDDRYYAIVDSTDNNFIQIEGPKTLTDGNRVPLNNRHQNRDNTPWHLGWTRYAKKNGLYYYSDNYSKWPRIYSRIGGVIDMEDAQRWDGSAWQWLSQKGKYLFGYQFNGSATNQGIETYNRADAVLSSHTPLLSPQMYIWGMAVCKNGVYIAVRYSNSLHSSDTIKIFKKDGDTTSLLQTLSVAVTDALCAGCAFSDDGMYFIVCNYNTSTNDTKIYKLGSNEQYSVCYTIPKRTEYAVPAFSPDGNYLLTMAYDTGYSVNNTCLYKRSGDSFIDITSTGLINIPNYGVRNIIWSDDSTKFYCSTTGNSTNKSTLIIGTKTGTDSFTTSSLPSNSNSWCNGEISYYNGHIIYPISSLASYGNYNIVTGTIVDSTFPATYPSCVSSSYFGVTPDGHFFYREAVNGLICGCSINSDGTISDVQSVFAPNNSSMNRFVVLN